MNTGLGVRRSRWMLLVDQAVYSVGNAIVVVAIARTAAPDEFAQFAIASVVAVSLAALGRWRYGESADRSVRRPSDLVLGFRSVAVVSVAVLLAGGVFGWSALPLLTVCVSPFLASAEIARLRMVLDDDGLARLLLVDAAWLLFVTIALVLDTPYGVLVAWAGGAVLVAAVGSRAKPAIVIGSNQRTTTLELGVHLIETNAVLVFLVVYGAAADVAAYRLILTAFGPLTVAVAAARNGVLRSHGRDTRRRFSRRDVMASASWVMMIGLGLGLVVVLTPQDLSVAIAGPFWPSDAPDRLLMALERVLAAGGVVLWLLLRVRQPSRLLRRRVGALSALGAAGVLSGGSLGVLVLARVGILVGVGWMAIRSIPSD